MSNAKDKGIQYISDAISCQNSDKFELALQNYKAGIEHLMHFIKYNKNESENKIIKIRVEEYMTTAEMIKEKLDNSDKKTINTQIKNNDNTLTKPKNDSENSEHSKEILSKMEEIKSSIVFEKPDVKFESIIGLETAKKALNEILNFPKAFSHMYKGIRKATNAVLLYGPPGTGKTQLARAAATQSNCVFFSISSSTILSKWVGDSEQNIKALFEVANQMAPSIIFLDEADSMFQTRQDDEQGATRRVKTEFLILMDGIKSNKDVFILAATNKPNDLDIAFLRRMPKKIYIPLPDKASRILMLSGMLTGLEHSLTEEDLEKLADLLDGYSGSDIKNFVNEAANAPLHRISKSKYFVKEENTDKYMVCDENTENKMEINYLEVAKLGQIKEMPILYHDFIDALEIIKATVDPSELLQYEIYTEKFGAK